MGFAETIAAISTPIGTSALSIVRICGQNALNIALGLTKSTNLTPRHAHLKRVFNANGDLIDHAIVIFFKAPHSFNGLDIVEIQTHGGSLAPKGILEAAIASGARLAKPGEFSKLALLNGKLDATQLEGISRLIVSQNEAATAMLNRVIEGELAGFVARIRGEIIEILAHIEALIDYAEEDLPSDLEGRIRAKLAAAARDLEALKRHSEGFSHIINGHCLAIIGRPNVGKSSILNRLLLKERAIVSPIAGTTRDTLEESLTIANQVVKIIDTAGIREVLGGGESEAGKNEGSETGENGAQKNEANEIEKIGIERAKMAAKNATIILAVFDGSEAFADVEILKILEENLDKTIIAALNKADLPQVFDPANLVVNGANLAPIKISTKDDSVYRLRDVIAQKITQNPLNDQHIALISSRQMDCVAGALSEIGAAQKFFSNNGHGGGNGFNNELGGEFVGGGGGENAGESGGDFSDKFSGELELFSFHLSAAARHLDDLSKPFNNNEVLDAMFGEFCLGK